MMREKYPEQVRTFTVSGYPLLIDAQVPFRLTRMLVRAMEISGVEGTFRITCENTMRVLRQHQESILAVLEAFVCVVLGVPILPIDLQRTDTTR